jgi:hypothetical protein
MSEGPKCGKTWWGKDGKDHACVCCEDHAGLTCICDCGERKWNGKSLPKKWMPK